MKSPPSRKLFTYRNARRGARRAPERSDIEPGAIRDILGDSFIIGFDVEAGHPFRLAGTRVCTLFGRELRGEPFMRLWDEASRELVGALVPTVADEAVAVVAGVAARTTEGSHADLKLLLPPPLYHRGRTHGRLLGVLAPISAHGWLSAERVGALEIGARPRDARPRRGLTVYDGGRK